MMRAQTRGDISTICGGGEQRQAAAQQRHATASSYIWKRVAKTDEGARC